MKAVTFGQSRRRTEIIGDRPRLQRNVDFRTSALIAQLSRATSEYESYKSNVHSSENNLATIFYARPAFHSSCATLPVGELWFPFDWRGSDDERVFVLPQ